MIGVVDYEAGNIASVSNAMKNIEIDFIVTSDARMLASCDGVILPGVGAAPGAVDSLRRRGLFDFLKNLRSPVLGICLGMQLLFESSEEGDTPCLGIVPETIRTLNGHIPKVPHMGWNQVEFTVDTPLNQGVGRREFFYFAHSFSAPVVPSTVAVTDCGLMISAAIAVDNYVGVQFHPEKSGDAGLRILKNFESICRSYRQ
jgi:glutamine amidotransferase